MDTYGSPWRHWLAILENVSRPTTVFLTVGQWQMATAREIREALGLAGLQVPPGIAVKLHRLATDYLLGSPALSGASVVEALEAVPAQKGSARYIGLHLLPGPGATA